MILPVDRGFEHGPARSFAANPPAYDPRYHFELAIESGCNAYAAPLGFLEAGAREFAGEIPLILKVNDHDALLNEADPTQALTSSVENALRLGCVAIGFTIYPGSVRHVVQSAFNGRRIAQIQRLRQDLGVNLVGAAIVLDLAKEVAQLRAQLEVYRSQPPNPR